MFTAGNVQLYIQAKNVPRGSVNSIGKPGWAVVLAGAEMCSGLAALDGLEVAGLMTGGLEALVVREVQDGSLYGDDGLAAALVPYLRRNASRLTLLDMRCVIEAVRKEGGGRGGKGSGPWVQIRMRYMLNKCW